VTTLLLLVSLGVALSTATTQTCWGKVVTSNAAVEPSLLNMMLWWINP
jgi:hypothetical protein